MITSRKKRKKRVEWFGQNLPLSSLCLWLVLSLVGALLPCADGTDVPGSITTTAYPSGEQCGTNPSWRCLSQAKCSELGLCQCPAASYGNGNFQCYPTNSIRAEITGTQTSLSLKSFRNTSATVNWPCRFRFTRFTTVRKDRGQRCDFQIFGVNQIYGGKVVMSGFEVHMQLTKDSRKMGGIGIRKDGRAQNNVYTYVERGKNGFVNEFPVTDENDGSSEEFTYGSGSGDYTDSDDDDSSDDDDGSDGNEWGPPEELYLGDGEKVVCSVDKDNFATVDVSSCRTIIRFRAGSVDGTQQDQLSGLSLTIRKDVDPIIFNSPETYLAEAQYVDILRRSAGQKNIKVEQEILHRSMEFTAKQHSSPEGLECEDTARIYRWYCQKESEKIKALDTCSFFLENANLISCMDPSRGVASSNSLNAFKLCLWNTCKPSKNVCNLLRLRVQQNGCISFTPTAFFDRECIA